MQKHNKMLRNIIALIVFVAGVLYFGNVAAAQTGFCMNASNFTNFSTVGVVGATAEGVFINFNLSGTGRLNAIVDDNGATTWRALVYNDSAWVRADNLTIGIPAGAGGPNRKHARSAGNLTGNYTMAVFRDGLDNVGFFQWNGSSWVNQTAYGGDVTGGVGVNKDNVILIDFPIQGRAAVISTSEPTSRTAFEWNGSRWITNASLADGLNFSYGNHGAAYFFNLTGRNKSNLFFVDSAIGFLITEWNGTIWNNVSVTGHNFVYDSGFPTIIRQLFENSLITPTGGGSGSTTRNWTNLTRYVNTASISGIVFNNSDPFFGEPVAVNATIGSLCGLGRSDLQANNGSGFVNVSQTRYSSATSNTTASFTITGTGICNRSFSFRYMLETSTGNITESITARFGTLPKINSSNASAAQNIGASCTERGNITLTFNRSDVLQIVLNMSKIVFGRNETCFYKASNTGKLRAINRTGTCEVTLIEVNASVSNSVLVTFDPSFSPDRPGNLGIAIAVGTISAITIAYVIARRRRTVSD